MKKETREQRKIVLKNGVRFWEIKSEKFRPRAACLYVSQEKNHFKIEAGGGRRYDRNTPLNIWYKD